jgi:hypothetical protein
VEAEFPWGAGRNFELKGSKQQCNGHTFDYRDFDLIVGRILRLQIDCWAWYTLAGDRLRHGSSCWSWHLHVGRTFWSISIVGLVLNCWGIKILLDGYILSVGLHIIVKKTRGNPYPTSDLFSTVLSPCCNNHLYQVLNYYLLFYFYFYFWLCIPCVLWFQIPC